MMFSEKVAIVTGGSSGIGYSTVIEMSSRGAAVIIADVDEENGEAAAKSVKDKGGIALFKYTDVSNATHISEMVEKSLTEFGRLDFAYNNAGIEGQQALLAEQKMTEVQHAFDVMINGVYMSMQAQIPAIMESGGGAIVNASSIWGLNCWPELSLIHI